MKGNLLADVVDEPVTVPIEWDKATDNELLLLFTRYDDEDAFRAIVERHGGLVMNVCRQVLQHLQEAEDVFQATFLILARKAPRMLQQNSLAGWLHQVAYRAALRASKNRRRQPQQELPEMDSPLPEAFQEVHLREVQQILHEELQKLKTTYREVIILCDLQGQHPAGGSGEAGLH